jgi:hypothetical protein
MHRAILTGSALALLLSSGLVHGLWTDRWSEQLDLAVAAAALDKVPRDFGSWHGEDLELEKDPRSGLVGMMSRCYTHTATGKAVTLFLACGRPGPVATHSPDVFYSCQGYEGETPRRFQLPSTGAQAPPEFWTARFLRQRNDGQLQLRIYWSWRAGDAWQAADNPRLAFAGERLLHKMYVIREMAANEASGERDACVEFMQDFLPELRQVLHTEKR